MEIPRPLGIRRASLHGTEELRGAVERGWETILAPEALRFVATLERIFGARRRNVLATRRLRQAELDAGARPDFLDSTQVVRRNEWRIAPVPRDLQDRRVEITGPVNRKLVIQALNAGANAFMADFEDSTSPTWRNVVEGQVNLFDAVRRTIAYRDPNTGKEYRLSERPATLLVRPRGWHLEERHFLVEGAPVSASLFDFGLFLFHNAGALLSRGSGPYFYLPKLENHQEARLWNDVFVGAQQMLGIPEGTIKATVLIETLTAAFEMDEILWELRQHSAGLNCGRWDYIFSFIKKLRSDPACVLPDRDAVTMERHFLRSYSRLLIQTCHRRGAHAMGGMAAQIPVKDDGEKHAAALAKVIADKRREAHDGHDGTWVAHPGLVETARREFDAVLDGPHQIDRPPPDGAVTAEDLLRVPSGDITEAGLRRNLRVGVEYLAAWLGGSGCVAIDHLMEDAATAEICRAQVWQWIRHDAVLEDGRAVTAARVRELLDEEVDALAAASPADPSLLASAASLFEALVCAPELAEFLTLPAYARLVPPLDLPQSE